MIEKLPNADHLIIEECRDQEPFTPGNYTQNDIVSMVQKINELVEMVNRLSEHSIVGFSDKLVDALTQKDKTD